VANGQPELAGPSFLIWLDTAGPAFRPRATPTFSNLGISETKASKKKTRCFRSGPLTFSFDS